IEISISSALPSKVTSGGLPPAKLPAVEKAGASLAVPAKTALPSWSALPAATSSSKSTAISAAMAARVVASWVPLAPWIASSRAREHVAGLAERRLDGGQPRPPLVHVGAQARRLGEGRA